MTSAPEKSITRMKGTFQAEKCRKVGEPEYLFKNFHIYISSERLYVARLRNITLPFGLGKYTRRSQPDIRWPHALILHLHFVVENGVREHDIELASCKVASGTSMTPVSERKELWGGGNNNIFLTILLEPHFREAETFKLFGRFSYVSRGS